MLRCFHIIVILGALTLGTPSASARSVANGSIALMLGTVLPQGSNAAFAFGAAFHYKIKGQRWRLGGFIRKYGVGVEAESGSQVISSSSSEFSYGAEIAHFLGGSLEGFHAGFMLGLSSVNINASATDGTSTITINESSASLFFGPKIGYDIANGRWSFGAEISYIISLGAGRSSFALLVPVKYWF